MDRVLATEGDRLKGILHGITMSGVCGIEHYVMIW